MIKKIKELLEFFNQVKVEGQKISFPTHKETLMVSLTVLFVLVVFSLVFLLIDTVIFKMINLFLGIGS